ncbi:MAG: hypothetical protein ABIK89_26145 [Planctomycetota bacterium]
MGWKKIKIDEDLYENVKRAARRAGYASPEEFIRHVLEKETSGILLTDDDEEKVKERLQGLGYLE